MEAKRENWVKVRLTAFGEQLAGGGPLLIADGAHNFEFRAGEEQEVTLAFDWNVVLRTRTIDGQNLFELVPAEE